MGWLALGASVVALVALVVSLTSIFLRRADSREMGRLEERVRALESRALKLTNALARARTADPSGRRLDELFGYDERPSD